MNILGISSYFHDSAACLIQSGRIIAAVQEERLSRIKGDPSFPVNAINFCLQKGGITTRDLHAVAISDKPFLKFSRVITGHVASWPHTFSTFRTLMPSWLNERLTLPEKLKKDLIVKAPVYFVPHHLSHAASAFLPSPCKAATIMTTDGVGEWSTMSLNYGINNQIYPMRFMAFPDSLGLIYTAVTTWLGFNANSGEGKTMALAALGKPSMLDELKEVVRVSDDGSININMKYFDFNGKRRSFTHHFTRKFGHPATSANEFEDHHLNMAASLQKLLEEALVKSASFGIELACKSADKSFENQLSQNICLAGGVHLNCLANSIVSEKLHISDTFIQPAAGDAGGCLGSALYVSSKVDPDFSRSVMKDAYLGPEYSEKEIERAILLSGQNFKKLNDPDLVKTAAELISEGKVSAWFNGPMEFGPRALGARSILADPRRSDMKDHLNKNVKHREDFRPFGASVLRDKANDYFSPMNDNPFMLMTSRLKEEYRSKLSSLIHIDGTSRIQTVDRETSPLYYAVIEEFERISGIPMIINTSFNDRGEPIVCSPSEAIKDFETMNLDALIMPPFIMVKS